MQSTTPSGEELLMARKRMISPEFWSHEELGLVPDDTHLLAVGLLNFSDDEGFFKASKHVLKAQVFPYRSKTHADLERMLNQLSDAGYIVLFTGTDGKPYGHVINFLKWQSVKKPQPSYIAELQPNSMHEVPNQFPTSSEPVGPKRKEEKLYTGIVVGKGERESEGEGKTLVDNGDNFLPVDNSLPKSTSPPKPKKPSAKQPSQLKRDDWLREKLLAKSKLTRLAKKFSLDCETEIANYLAANVSDQHKPPAWHIPKLERWLTDKGNTGPPAHPP